MIPVYKIEAGDKDITATIRRHLASFRITDAKGFESDSFEMTLTDPNAEIEWPTIERRLKVSIGYDDKLVFKGDYTTDEVSFAGPADHFVIKARGADMTANSPLKIQRTTSWHKKESLGKIIEEVASRNKLKAKVSKRFYDIKVEHIDQSAESDLNFVTRLAHKYFAIVKITDGNLIFADQNTAKTVSGDDMPAFKIFLHQVARDNGYHFTHAGKSEYTGVIARWHDVQEKKPKEFEYKPLKKTRTHYKSDKEREAAQRKQKQEQDLKNAKTKEEHEQLKRQQEIEDRAIYGESGNVKTLKKVFGNEEEAMNAAEAEYNRLLAGKDTAEITLQQAIPELTAECKIELVGFRKGIDRFWITKEVSFDFSKSSGLTAHLQLEKSQIAEDLDAEDAAI